MEATAVASMEPVTTPLAPIPAPATPVTKEMVILAQVPSHLDTMLACSSYSDMFHS